MSELSLFTGALTPCLAATLGHKRLPWLLTALEQLYRCSKTVVNEVEQAGFEGIPALVISVEEEGLQGLLQTDGDALCDPRQRTPLPVLHVPFL